MKKSITTLEELYERVKYLYENYHHKTKVCLIGESPEPEDKNDEIIDLRHDPTSDAIEIVTRFCLDY